MRLIIFFLFVSFLISCGDPATQEVEKKPVATSQFSMAKEHNVLVYIKTSNEKEISNWEYYTTVREFLDKFKKITPNEALGNALELTSLIKALKDSAKPEALNTSSLKARINLLENESLRLSDMTKISAIKAEEVNRQVTKVFDAFSSLNSKINTVFLQQNLSKDLDFKDFDFSVPEKKESTSLPETKKKVIPKKSSPTLMESLNKKEKTNPKKLPFKDKVKLKRAASKKVQKKKSTDTKN
ncbi:hypothetical protein RQM59_09620 [Flavobacteriaceae bacterium S356]|uniref:Lipoprotein n=1 Tax=Asprobacillus argus TaxID=3076534 RepID=A0ABU3LFY0_9FLAO|nr:hypothetical protein [Flavobacteriaceae bacterium S356]